MVFNFVTSASTLQPPFNRNGGQNRLRYDIDSSKGLSMQNRSTPLKVLLLAAALSLFLPFRTFAQQADLARDAVMLLEAKCIACHGPAQMSGLDMRQRETLLKGGSRGPAIRSGDAEGSLLFQAVSHQGELKMPPDSKSPLPTKELAVLKKWIEQGAPWPEGLEQKAESAWWSFREVQRPEVPRPKRGKLVRNPIDAFILAKLKEKGLKPAPLADKQTLLRRAYFDLLGLPPTTEQVERFLQDTSPGAFRKVIDQLLASPHYGERWGRHWLDVVRYADAAGFEGDNDYPTAWRYRDYVIKSFNDDKPYDRFVQEQIAADELWPDNQENSGTYAMPLEKLEHLEARVGTGLYTFGPENDGSQLNGARLRHEWLTDAVDTTGAAFLGLTLQCARCHNHKFDPIPQKDYYGLQAIFAASQPATILVVDAMSSLHRRENHHVLLALDEARRGYRQLEKEVKGRVIESQKKEFPAEVVQAFEVPEKERTAEQNELAAPLVKAYEKIKIEEHLMPEQRDRYQQWIDAMVESLLALPPKDLSHEVYFDALFDLPSAAVLGHVQTELVPTTHVLSRGELDRPLAPAQPRLPAAFGDGRPFQWERYGPRYRKQFALWLTSPDHPLTARVMVNRIWQGHFGRGIVATANDFGHKGAPPTHPELLDWLASEFLARGWSIKSMHRLIMLSYTYQMSSRFQDPANLKKDPQNHYLWQKNRRRLEAEALWDSIHWVAGTLNLKMYGRPVMPRLSETELAPLRVKKRWVPPSDPAEGKRRGIYILARRNFSFPMFEKFDMADPNASCPQRDVTTVAPQALWTLNNPMTFEQAKRFAARLAKENGKDPSAWVEAAWRLALARRPSTDEKREALQLMEQLSTSAGEPPDSAILPEPLAKLGSSRGLALAKLCLTLFNLSEFNYID